MLRPNILPSLDLFYHPRAASASFGTPLVAMVAESGFGLHLEDSEVLPHCTKRVTRSRLLQQCCFPRNPDPDFTHSAMLVPYYWFHSAGSIAFVMIVRVQLPALRYQNHAAR